MSTNKKKVALRVDASTQIGTGHFMRCLTLADGLQQRGVQTRFISRYLPEHLQSMLSAKKHEFMLLSGDQNNMCMDELAHACWLGVSQEQDAGDSTQALSDAHWDWLIVDHYALDFRWESILRRTAEKILVIDDIADRQHDCDLLLDQNLYSNMKARYENKVPAYCQLLLGPRYALLRDEFCQLHDRIKPRRRSVKRVLVFFGGIDVDNYTGNAIEALSKMDLPDLHVDVVIGIEHPAREQIEADCARLGFICHVQTNRMAELMAMADLAIGAGGSAVWERCCLGLPTLTLCVAKNQHKQITDAAFECLLYAPKLEGELIFAIARHVDTLMENDCLRTVFSLNGMQVVDGRGLLRVIGSLSCSGIEIRLARSDDSDNLLKWRNHPSIRAAARKPDIISRENHQKWLHSVLASSDKLLLIGEREGVPVGVVRFDIHADEAEVSIYLVPEAKQRGQGRELLQSSEYWFSANRPKVNKITAYVLGNNERSHHLFLGMGYQVESTNYLKRLH